MPPDVEREMIGLVLALSLASGPQAKESSAAKGETASTLVNRAVAKAKAEGKNVFVHFGASWCPWCRKLDALLEDPKLKSGWERSYVPVKITVREREERAALENPGWSTLMKSWRGTDEGDIPYIVILDAKGKKLADSAKLVPGAIPNNAGYPQTSAEIDAFLGTLKRTGKFEPSELSAIRAKVTPQRSRT